MSIPIRYIQNGEDPEVVTRLDSVLARIRDLILTARSAEVREELFPSFHPNGRCRQRITIELEKDDIYGTTSGLGGPETPGLPARGPDGAGGEGPAARSQAVRRDRP